MPPSRRHPKPVTVPVKHLDDITLYPSRRAWALVFLVCLGFTILCYVFRDRGSWEPWVGLVLFGSGTVLSLALVLFPGISSLRLTLEGFYIRAIFRAHFVRWKDVACFGVISISGHSMVVFNYVPGYAGQRFGRTLARDMTGWEGALNDTYGMNAEELIALMIHWKQLSESRPNEQSSGDETQQVC